jgi:hypothetical protein
LSAVRERYFSHIKSDRYLLRKISAGAIRLKVTRLGGSSKGQAVVYLHDLANYLDDQSSKAAKQPENSRQQQRKHSTCNPSTF